MTDRSERWTRFRDRQREDIANAVIAAVSNSREEPLNVTEVVDLAGISRKTFYKYFDSLPPALVYTRSQVRRGLTEHAEAAVADAPNGRERFLGLLADLVSVANRSPDLIRFINYFDHTFRGKEQQHNQHEQETYIAADSENVTQAFLTGQADGSIRTDLDPSTNVFVIGNSIIGLVQRFEVATHADNPDLMQSSIDLLVDVWRRHLAPGPGERSP
ncbi:TetR/AcrR family transcriptional regulator [Nocardia sp. NBC_01377]|uniref:TetR/AcrR family transcriptional regulator n=1 Tax=Nocardia sp. NBC_01377 TaxID=2903595 RepID=UPI003244F26B